MTAILKLIRDRQEDPPFTEYRKDITSQFGEDGVIARLVELLNPPPYCVEFGAADGVENSNTNQLVMALGWAGLMIEANPAHYPKLRETYAAHPSVTTVNRCVGLEGDATLDRILKEYDVPKEIGLLSIDVDGADYHIWESLTLFEPEIVVIEFNPTVPNDVFFVQERSLDINQGSSLLAMACLGVDKGYKLAACTLSNAIFVREDKFHLMGVTCTSLPQMYRPHRDGRIFQGYDGTIFVTGMPDLVWHGRQLEQDDHQVLPKSLRFYPHK